MFSSFHSSISFNMRAVGLSLHHPLPYLSSKLANSKQKLYRCMATAAIEDSDDQWCRTGRMVDKSMPVLRKRLKEIKALDRGTGQYANELVELEEGYSHTFISLEMLELLGILKLQSYLSEEERSPKLLIGFSVMLTVNLPIPMLVAVLHLKDAAKGIIDVMRLNRYNDC
ncbi:hypothetical protein M5K25_016132 [Dendrobium thyrsiflorum]|uniref:Uncharacterized protein n=1 Tax=Dendrobium thyrsiflorum TaxID=117978 RepID=A0ABD0US63_DENTH